MFLVGPHTFKSVLSVLPVVYLVCFSRVFVCCCRFSRAFVWCVLICF